MRASLASMPVARRLFEERTRATIESQVAPLGEVYRLQGAAEFERAEKVCLPCKPVATEPLTSARSA